MASNPDGPLLGMGLDDPSAKVQEKSEGSLGSQSTLGIPLVAFPFLLLITGPSNGEASIPCQG